MTSGDVDAVVLPGTGRGTGAAGGGGSPRTLRPETLLARRLRRTLTLPEIILWTALRGGRTGLRFRRQYPIGPYVADFCCLSERLVVEVDGEAHSRGRAAEHDRSRDLFMKENGYRVLRVMAADVQRDVASVVAAIVACAVAPLHQPPAGPPPRSGEE